MICAVTARSAGEAACGSAQRSISAGYPHAAPDKFAALELVEGKGGTPVLPDALARFECRTVTCSEAGDHMIVLGEIESYDAPGGSPLIFHGGTLRGVR